MQFKNGLKYCLLLVSVICLQISYGSWVVEDVDDNGDVYGYTSIVIDKENDPHILYRDSTDDCIKHCKRGWDEWRFDLIEDGGGVLALGVKSDGSLCASYSLDTGYYRVIRYAERGLISKVWEISSVDYLEDTNGDKSLSMVVDIEDNIHITYYDGEPNYDLKYAKRDGNEWSIEIVAEEGYVGIHNSVDVDISNSPHITYVDNNDHIFKYARQAGENWIIEAIDDEGHPGYWSSIAVDSNGYPHIAYSSGYPTDNLKYARWDGNTWSIETVFPERFGGMHVLLKLDVNDYPHIAQRGWDRLEYIWWDGGTWRIEEDVDYFGKHPSLALDNIGDPHISYHFDSYYHNNLRYALLNTPPEAFDHISPNDGDTVKEPVTLDWENTTDGGQHEIRYNLWYSPQEDFTPREEVDYLSGSAYTIPNGTLEDLQTYYWKVAATDNFEETWSGLENDEYRSFTVNNDHFNMPKTYVLLSPIPNPSSGETSIIFALPRNCEIDLSVYNIKGRKIATLAEGDHIAGEYEIPVSGLTSGVYLYRLKTDEFIDLKKMIIR